MSSTSDDKTTPSPPVSPLTVGDGGGCEESGGGGGGGGGGTHRPSVPTIDGDESKSTSESKSGLSSVGVVVDGTSSATSSPSSSSVPTVSVEGHPPRSGHPSLPSSSPSSSSSSSSLVETGQRPPSPSTTTPTTPTAVVGPPSVPSGASQGTTATATATGETISGSTVEEPSRPSTVTPVSWTPPSSSSSGAGGSHTNVNPLGRALLQEYPHLSVASKLGNGGFGDVYKAAKYNGDKLEGHVVVKIARLPDVNTTTDQHGAPLPPEHLHELRHKVRKLRRAQVEEAGALKSIPPHRHVLSALSIHDTRRWGLLIVLPLAPHGDVRSWLRSGRRSWEERLCVVIGMAFGLRHLHSLGLVHQDVKEGNVLMFDDCVARVSDFGLVRGLDGGRSAPPPDPSTSSSSGSGAGAGAGSGAGSGSGLTPSSPAHPPSTSETTSMSESHTVSWAVTFAGGTRCYMSPEARRGERPTVLSDMWSFGLVSWAVLHGSGRVSHDVPWGVDDGSRVRGFVESSLRGLSGSESVPVWLDNVVEVVGDCLAVDVKSRLSSRRVVSGLEDMWRRHGGGVSSEGRGLVDGLMAAEADRSSSKDSRRSFELSRAGWLWGQRDRWEESVALYESVVGWATGLELVEAGCRLSSLYGGLGDEGGSVAAGVKALHAAVAGDRLGVWRQLAKESRSVGSFRSLLGSDVGLADAMGWSTGDVVLLLESLFENEDSGVCESALGAIVSSVDGDELAEALGSGWPLIRASQHGHVGVVRRLLGTGGVDVNRPVRSGQTALWVAAKAGLLEVVEALLVNGADVASADINGVTPLHDAATGGYLDVVEVLLSHEADVNARGQLGTTPLWMASQDGHLGVVEALLAAKADVNAASTTAGATPLHIASQKGHLGVVEALLAAQADVNAARTTAGATPLYVASQNGHLDVVEALLAAKADVNAATTDGGTTSLWMASHNGHLGVVEALLAAKADANVVRTTDGCTPLLIASQNGHLGVVEALLAAKADANAARTTDGTTPLLIASQNGHSDVVKALLRACADPHGPTTTSPPWTPLKIAVHKGHTDIVALLRNHKP